MGVVRAQDPRIAGQNLPTGRAEPEEVGQAALNLLKVEAGKVEAQQEREDAVDDAITLHQDSERQLVNLGARTYVPLPHQVAALDQASLKAAHEGQRNIPKNPIGERRLAHFGHRGKPPVKGRQRVLLGDAPKQQVPHRPRGAGNAGSVTVA